MTHRDVLEGNPDLIDAAAEILSKERPHSMDVDFDSAGDALPARLTIHTRHVTRIDVMADGRPLRSFDIGEGETTVDLDALIGDWSAAPKRVELFAYEDDELVIRRRYPDRPVA
jgi:hypothetical protein